MFYLELLWAIYELILRSWSGSSIDLAIGVAPLLYLVYNLVMIQSVKEAAVVNTKYPDTQLQDALAHTADDIMRQAGEDFDAWRSAHEEEIGNLDMLEQIEIYAADAAWHSA